MKLNISINQGSTFSLPVRWETNELVYVPILSISQDAPAVVVTTEPHNMPDGWRAAFVSCDGMEQVNAHTPARDSDYRAMRVLTPTSVSVPAFDTADYDAYTGGGFLQYYLPQPLAGYDARMSIRDRIRGSELLGLSVANGRILLDDVLKTITLLIAAADTAAITWLRGVYDLELVYGTVPTEVVTRLLNGSVTVSREVTI
jgi:hypothetical protein